MTVGNNTALTGVRAQLQKSAVIGYLYKKRFTEQLNLISEGEATSRIL